MKIGDLVRRVVSQADGVHTSSMGIIVEDLGSPGISWDTRDRQWAVLWAMDGIPKFRMECGASVMFENELEVISLA